MLISSGGLYLTLMEIEIELRTNFVSRVARSINVTLVLFFHLTYLKSFTFLLDVEICMKKDDDNC